MENSKWKFAYWDSQIIRWSRKRYGSKFFRSIFFREQIALDILRHNVVGESVLELGCGVGRLGIPLSEAGAEKYLGIDFSPIAISEARKNKLPSNVEFDCRELSQINSEFTLILSLGLTDWVDDEGLAKMAELSRGRKFLHSFSEKNNNLIRFFYNQLMGRLYRARKIQPRHYGQEEMLLLFGDSSARIIRDHRMSFGCFITNLQPQ